MLRLPQSSALVLVCWTAALGQTQVPATSYSIHVRVTDSQNHPRSGAEIRIDDTTVGLSDIDGDYYMSRRLLPAGAHAISARLAGYSVASQQLKNLAQIMANPGARGVDVRLKLV